MENTIIQNFPDEIFEGMTSISALISAIESNNNSRKIKKILFDKSKLESKKREFSFLRIKSKSLFYELLVVSSTEIDKIATGTTHGGVVAITTPREIPKLSPENVKKDGIYYIFEGIEDPYNFGYVIRSVYASGADGIIVSERNWFDAAAVVARSSAGTSELINTYVSEPSEAVDMLKKMGYTVVCAGIRNSQTIYETELKRPLLVIIGGEKRGISRIILDKADKIVRIDYGRQFRGSLPSVAATAIISFEIMRKINGEKND